MKSKVPPTAHSHPRSIRYVAATDAEAEQGAAALEGVQSGPELTVHPTTSVDRTGDWIPEVDCVVFDGDPASTDLTATVEASAETPVVVLADGPYAATDDGVDGYVRRDTEDAVVHLADEIARVCEASHGAARSQELEARTAATVFETTAGLASCRERDRLFDRLVDGAVSVLGFEYCWLATINFGELVPRAGAPAVPDDALEPRSLEDPLGVAFRAREAIRIADLANYEWIDPPFDGVRSLCSVPVGDVGVLHVAAESPSAFDAADLALLEGICEFAATVLERNWAERGVVNERDRLRRERSRFVERYERLRDERDALFTLFRNVSEPTLRYDLEDGQPVVSGVNATFEAVFGVDRDDVVGGAVEAAALPDGLADRSATLLEAVSASERRELECRRETPDGVRDFLLTVVPLDVTDAAGGRDGGLLVYEDVTRQRRHERDLLAQRRRLERIADRIDEEARTPLNTARGYLELAEKTGDGEHFDVVEDAHEQLSDRLHDLVGVATGDDVAAEPVSLQDVARRAWITAETGEAQFVGDGDLLLEADRDGLRALFEAVLRTAIEFEDADETDEADETGGDHDADETGGAHEADAGPVTVTVGATDDGFYVAGSRPAASQDRDGGADPDPGRLDDADGTELQLELVERIAEAHGWDVGVAEDDDGTAFAFRGVESLAFE